jgi:AcrR family transcriptional regulator
MTVLKTRAKLVDVARQLFAKKGVEDTTMNDIAQASKKGRRTLYTYFKSKEQIYMAVVESELEMLSTQMEKAASKPVSPDKKILELIMTHLDAIKMVVYRNGTLRADFFRDIWRVEAMRKEFDRKETALFRRVLHEGKELNLFDIDNVEITADILHYCIKGIEVPYIRGQIGEELDDETGWPRKTGRASNCATSPPCTTPRRRPISRRPTMPSTGPSTIRQWASAISSRSS